MLWVGKRLDFPIRGQNWRYLGAGFNTKAVALGPIGATIAMGATRALNLTLCIGTVIVRHSDYI